MIRLVATIFGGLLGLAFGSFLNVCLSRWPEDESVVGPRSHCRSCARTLAWWENVPVVSWLGLRGRCRGCGTAIGWRYPLVELAVGLLWALAVYRGTAAMVSAEIAGHTLAAYVALAAVAGKMIFFWLLIALALLDAKHYWLPDFLTLGGAGLGMGFKILSLVERRGAGGAVWILGEWVLGVGAAALLVLVIRWGYWLVRRREGMGLGDVKLMAMLAAWLGLPATVLAFSLGAVMGALVAVLLLVWPGSKTEQHDWAASRLPFGTFLCIGGIVSALWGVPMIAAYMRWAGF